MTQVAKRSKDAPACSCGKQPMHVCRQDGRDHFIECPPCGIRTGKFASHVLALMAWRSPSKETQPLRVVGRAA